MKIALCHNNVNIK